VLGHWRARRLRRRDRVGGCARTEHRAKRPLMEAGVARPASTKRGAPTPAAIYEHNRAKADHDAGITSRWQNWSAVVGALSGVGSPCCAPSLRVGGVASKLSSAHEMTSTSASAS